MAWVVYSAVLVRPHAPRVGHHSCQAAGLHGGASIEYGRSSRLEKLRIHNLAQRSRVEKGFIRQRWSSVFYLGLPKQEPGRVVVRVSKLQSQQLGKRDLSLRGNADCVESNLLGTSLVGLQVHLGRGMEPSSRARALRC